MSGPARSEAPGRTAQARLSALHLVHGEITAVTSAMRKQLFISASSSFLGGGSSSSGSLAVAAGTTAASLTRAAVAAAAVSFGPPPTEATPAPNGAPSDLGSSLGLRTPGASAVASGSRAAQAGRRAPAYPGERDEGMAGLLNGFTVLRAQLREQPDLGTFPLPVLLAPFLRVILSPRVTGPVTSAALQSLHKILIHGVVRFPAPSGEHGYDADPQSALLAVAEVAHAVSHCRFEASDPATDELVLLRILAVMRELVCADGGEAEGREALANRLGDESICEMVETGLSMCCQMRLSDLLRRTAEQSMIAMARKLFSRLAQLPTSDDEAWSSDPNDPSAEPEHATLAAEPVGTDGQDDERRLRRMTMPDPKSSEVPAAAAAALQELKAIGEAEEQEEQDGQDGASGAEGAAAQAPADPEASGESEAKLGDGPEGDKSAEPSQPSAVSAHENSVFERQQQTAAALLVEPYGLPAIKEILRVVVSLLDPQTTQHTEAMRLLGLAMLSSILELASHSIARFPSLRAIIQDSACKHLFQLARSEHSRILALALRAIAILFETMREHLKLQYELFLTFTLDRLAPNFPIALEPWNDEAQVAVAAKRARLSDGPSRTGTPEPAGAKATPPPPPPPPPPHPKSSERAPATGETRELMLETLSLLLRSYEGQQPGSPDALIQLWVNFDCDVDCENMFERFIHFLCRSVYASNPQFPGQQDSTQVLALDALLNFVGMMTARQEGLKGAYDVEDATIDNADSLMAQKGHKAAILTGAARFNAKPKDGLAFLEAQGFIDTSGKNGETRAQSVAKFLKDCPRLDKKLLGDYISRPEHLDVLVAFINLFDFRDKSIAEALRELLETFRLPGESQQISRITETFASAYFAVGPAEIRNEDAVYVLAYSVIMLNTDLHNPQNKRRMGVDDYRRNLRGVNDGKDFDPEYLGAIYDVIRKREIVMPEEHVGQLGFDYAWKELLRRSRKAGPLLLPHTAVFDRAVFESCWRPVVASIAHAFSSYRDEHLLERAIGGFRQCAILASRFGMYELFDYMIQGLAGATGLLDDRVPGSGALTNNAVVDVDGQSITVSPLSVRFGANFKGQLAAVVLFTIANGNGDAIRAGWAPIFEIFKNLFVSSLLPAPLSHMHDFAKDGDENATPDGLIPIPLKPRKAPGPPPQDPRAQGGGLFSTLSSYLLSPYSAANEPAAPDVTAEDVESSLCTVDCITSCRLDELYTQVLELSEEALLPALRALKALADRCSIERVAAPVHEQHRLVQDRESGSSGRSTPTNSTGSALAGARAPLQYDPTAIFAMELLTSVACSSTAVSTAEAWSIASEHLIDVLKMPRLMHPMHIERAVASLLRLAEKISPSAEGALRDQIFVALDLLRSIPAELHSSISPQLVAGLTQIIRSDPGFARSQTEWGLVLALIADHSVTRNARAAALASDAVRQIAQQRLTSDNFAGVVSLLRSFAAGADCSGWRAEEQRQSQRRTLTEKKELADYETQCQQRGVEAIVALEGMKSSIPRLVDASGLAAADAWTQFWLPLMTALSEQCANRHRPAREAAITHLQRTLLASEILSGTAASLPQRSTLVYIFTAVVFPTLDELLKDDVFKLDVEGILEARIRMCALLSKVYLHYLPQLAAPADEPFQRLWMQVLDNLERYLRASKHQHESIPELTKNVLLVMNASEVLLPPPAPSAPEHRSGEQIALWALTAERLAQFLPGLLDELFAPPAPMPEAAAAAPSAPGEGAGEQHAA